MTFSYGISGHGENLEPGSTLWRTPLSKETGDDLTGKSVPFLIGSYFESAREFILQKQCKPLLKGIEFLLKKAIPLSAVKTIHISLEKHGAFYHPLKIGVETDQAGPLLFALNGAVAMPGLRLIETEYSLLAKLNIESPKAGLPEVFGSGKVFSMAGEAGFFLAQWLDGYKEFHITRSDQGFKIGVWESDGTMSHLPMEKCYTIYEKACEILTRFYNLETFEQIFPWHHAAGDFVVKGDDGIIDVRLITVRGYGSMIGADPGEFALTLEDVNNGLLFFLLNLSIRMRLDRIDGTGPHHLLDSAILPYLLKGFFSSLGKKTVMGLTGRTLQNRFAHFLLDFSPEDIRQLCEIIIDSYNPDATEIALIKENLGTHCVRFHHAIEHFLKNSFFIDKAQ